MVRHEVFASRLQRLERYLEILRTLQGYALEQYVADPLVHGAAERYLHLAIECMLDLGNHLIADRGWRTPESYADVLRTLEAQQVMPVELARRLDGMAGFRNLLVHDYLRLEHEEVHRILAEKLDALADLGAIFRAIV